MKTKTKSVKRRNTTHKRLVAMKGNVERLRAVLHLDPRTQTEAEELVAAWRNVRAARLVNLPADSFSHDDGDGRSFTWAEARFEQLTEARERTAAAVESALLNWQPEFFESLAKEMRRELEPFAPDAKLLALLKAAQSGGPVNCYALAKELTGKPAAHVRVQPRKSRWNTGKLKAEGNAALQSCYRDLTRKAKAFKIKTTGGKPVR
jgi:hypothetical protein